MGQVGNNVAYIRFPAEEIRTCRLFFRRGISVGIPSAAFQLEAARGEYFLGLVAAFGALDRFGIHPYQRFGNMATSTLKFVNRHRSVLSESG